MGVSKNNGTPKSSILIAFSTINHPFWGTAIFGNIHINIYKTKYDDHLVNKEWIEAKHLSELSMNITPK